MRRTGGVDACERERGVRPERLAEGLPQLRHREGAAGGGAQLRVARDARHVAVRILHSTTRAADPRTRRAPSAQSGAASHDVRRRTDRG